jgi:hypothetical protein
MLQVADYTCFEAEEAEEAKAVHQQRLTGTLETFVDTDDHNYREQELVCNSEKDIQMAPVQGSGDGEQVSGQVGAPNIGYIVLPAEQKTSAVGYRFLIQRMMCGNAEQLHQDYGRVGG